MKFEIQNAQDWIKIQTDLFNNNIPEYREWTDKSDIVKVLSLIGQTKDSNHVLLSSIGGLDLEGANNSNERGCIELDFKYAYVVKPIRLLFQSFKDKPEWNYFRLETAEILPSGIYETDDNPFESEELTETSPGSYASIENWEDLDKPKSTRIVIRASAYTYLIVQKTGPYNDLPLTYDGIHGDMSANEFKTFIEAIINNM